MQAGNSPQGRDFAAKRMDAVLCAVSTVEEMKAFRATMRKKVAAAGRDPDSCKVMYVATPTIGESDDEAWERVRRRQAHRKAAPELALAQMGSLTDIDFSVFDIDAPIGELTTNGQQGTLKRFLKQGATLREIAQNYKYSYEDLVGTPDKVAGQMAELMEEVGGDGFVFTGNLTRRYIAEITDGLVPALQRRGVVRRAYEHQHFRDNLLGLLMPPLGKMILRRLLWVFPVAFGVVTMTFFMARVLNGDPTELYAPPEATDALRAEIRARLGLADPLPLQFVNYHLRTRCASISASPSPPARTSRPTCGIGCPPRSELGLVGLSLGIAVGIPLGVLAAVHRERWPDFLVRGTTLSGMALPQFWVGLVLDQHLLRRPALAAGTGRSPADRHRAPAQDHRLPAGRHAARRPGRTCGGWRRSRSPCRR